MRSRPRILIIGIADTSLGYYRVLRNIFSNLHHTHELHFFSVNASYPEPIDFESTWTNPYEDDLLGTQALPEILDEVQPHLVFWNHDFWLYNLHREALLARPHIKTVFYCPVEGSILKPEAFENAWELDALVTYTEYAKNEMTPILEKNNKAASKNDLCVIPHGLDVETFYPIGAETGLSFDPQDIKKRRNKARRLLFPEATELQDAFIVLNANKIFPRKCIDLTLKGFEGFARDKTGDVKLYLHKLEDLQGIDDESIRIIEKLKARNQLLSSDSMGLNSEPLTDTQLNLLFNACDVGINTASAEGWGLIPFEHAATAAVQIVPGHGAPAEIWENAGLVLPVEKTWELTWSDWRHHFIAPNALTKYLERLYRDPEWRATKAAECYQFAVQERFRWNTIANQWNTVFDKVLMISKEPAFYK